MRFIFFLLLFHFIYSTALSQSLSGHITKLEKEIADAKSNNADPAKIKELEKILEQMKFTQSYLDKAVIPKPKTSVSSFPGASWSGFLSSTKEGSSQLPVSTRSTQIYLFFSDAIPTLHRDFNENDELNFTDDKGSGSVKDHSVITIGTQTSTCDCSGGGTSELHEVAVNKLDSTYSIDATAPICTGGNSEDGSCGMTWSITISNQKFTNPNILSGTRTETTEIAGMKGTVTNTWYLMRTIDAELIVKPRDYDTWLPEPGKDEKTVGKTMTVDLMLQGKNGKPLKQKAKSFEIMLNNTSREPGITINFPLSPVKNGTPPDLQLLEQAGADVEDESQKMNIDCGGCTTANFKIGAFDGGAFSNLTVVAVLDDDTRIVGNLLVSGGPTDITIPKRNGSMIGEAWLKKYGNPKDFDDKDSSFNNSNDGDGLTAYEEYRGIVSKGGFKRLDPAKKELGILIVERNKNEAALFTLGISRFKKQSDIDVILFDKNEIPDNRRINQNSANGLDFKQFVLRLSKGNTGEPDMDGDIMNVFGVAYGGGNIPAKTTHVVIDVDRIQKYYKEVAQSVGALNLPFTGDDLVASTTAHELGHGVSVNHHGLEIPYLNGFKAMPDSTPAVRLFYDYSREITTRPYDVTGPIASPGDHQSGNVSCFMCYRNKTYWVRHIGTNNELSYYRIPLLAAGSTFCMSKDGTDINSGGRYFGDTPIKGDCMSQLKLRD